MKAMLLSAGLGRRMLPLTLATPKPAIPVLGRPMAAQILERLAVHGIGEAVVNLHHLPEVVERVLRNFATALPKVHLSREERILGTAGGIRHAASKLRGEGPILVHNGDFLSDIDIRAIVERHRSSGHLATLVLTAPRPGYSEVEIDSDGRVLSLAGQPEASPGTVTGRYLFTGCHLIEESILERIPAEGASGIVSDVYRGLAGEGRVGSYLHDGFWWEFGSPEQYLAGSLLLVDLPADRRREIAVTDPVREIGGASTAVGPGVQLHDGARIEGRVAIGFACSIGRDAFVRESVILPEAWIGPGCRLSGVIIGPRAELPAGFVCHDAVIVADPGGNVPLASGVRREGALLIRPLRATGAPCP